MYWEVHPSHRRQSRRSRSADRIPTQDRTLQPTVLGGRVTKPQSAKEQRNRTATHPKCPRSRYHSLAVETAETPLKTKKMKLGILRRLMVTSPARTRESPSTLQMERADQGPPVLRQQAGSRGAEPTRGRRRQRAVSPRNHRTCQLQTRI